MCYVVDILSTTEHRVRVRASATRSCRRRWAIRDSRAHFVRFGTVCDGMFTHEAQLKKPKKLDRRVQRTRQLLQDALLAMVLEKGYDSTTVQDIIDRANVGRATFYAHFPDK